jgi:hypothetical protein
MMQNKKNIVGWLSLLVISSLLGAQKASSVVSSSLFTQDASVASPIRYVSVHEGVSQDLFFSKASYKKIRHDNRSLGSFEDERGFWHSKPFFTTSFLKKYKKVSSFIASPPQGYEHCRGELITCLQGDGYRSQAYFFDRKSDILIVAAPGFGYAKEIMTPVVELFPHFDILLLEHRGHGKRLEIKSIYDQIVHKLFGIAPSWIICGQQEVDDLVNVIQSVRQNNASGRHKKVLGLGFCYSSLLFSQAAVQNTSLFTHLVCDGAVVALSEVFSRVQEDVSLFSQIFGGNKGFTFLLRHPTLYSLVAPVFLALCSSQSIFHRLLSSALSNVESFSSLQIPVMIWQGTADKLVSQEDFELLFNRLASPHKCAIITPHRHLLNYLKEKELYAWAITRFLTDTDLTVIS